MRNILISYFSLALAVSFSQKISTSLTYLVKEPVQKTTKAPVIIMLHGYGSNEADLFEISNTLDGRFIVFSLRAPFEATGGGFSWYTLEFLPDRQFKYNYKEATESRAKILSFISKACSTYGVDSTNVFLMGFSQGAMMAYDLALNAPKKIKGVLILSGRMMEESKTIKTDWQKVTQVKFFIAHGQSDNVIKLAEAQKANDFLKSKQVADLTYATYQMPHSLSGKELTDLKRWLVKAISPKKEPAVKK